MKLLLSLRYPIRCQDCGERAWGFVWQVLALRVRRRLQGRKRYELSESLLHRSLWRG